MLRFFEYLNSLLSAHNAIKGSAIAAVVALFVWFVFGSQIEGLFSPKAEPVRLPVVQQLQTGNFLSEQSNVSTKSATPQTQTAIESEREQKSTLVDEMKAIKKEAIQKRVQ